MITSNIEFSGFSLSKGNELKNDDFYDVKIVDNLIIAIVCDGVGSALCGGEASQRVTKSLMANFKNRPTSWSIEKSIKSFIVSINSILYQESILHYERVELVTTLAIIVIEGNRLYGANVGDSRVYLHRDNKLNQISLDHSLEEEKYKHIITKAIGMDETVNPYYFENIVKKNDKILLCSDGLYSILDDDSLEKNIFLGANLVVKKASKLVNDDLPDDTSAVVVEILQENEIEKLKALDLDIPQNLKSGDNIDGFILEKSLIANNRTWICNKNRKNYVLKFPPVEAKEDKIMLDLFVKEAWNSKRVKAGFFPKAVIPKNRTARYYAQEYINGINLKEFLKKRKLHIDDGVNLAKTLLNASQYLLKFDLVHADIKPENIMVVKRGDKLIFKIVDFGSMCEIYSIDSNAGTPSYLAPQRFNKTPINETSEIFAIGVTLYESLSTKLPYGEIEPFQNPTFRPPKSPKIYNNNIPLWLDTIILRSISIDTKSRYGHYSQMIYELEHTEHVKPFYPANLTFLERNPLRTYQVLFYIMLIINIYCMSR